MQSRIPATVIVPSAVNRTLLEDVIQSQLHVEYILRLNDDHTLEPGHLQGISLMLANAEKTLAEARAALSAMHYRALSHAAVAPVRRADCPELQPST